MWSEEHGREAQLNERRRLAVTLLFWLVMLLFCAALIRLKRNDGCNWSRGLSELATILALLIAFNTVKAWIGSRWKRVQ